MNPIESIPYLRVVLDEKAHIVEIELKLEDALYDEKELIGKNWFETFIDQAYEGKIKEVFEKVLEGSGSFDTYENDIVCKDGTHKFIDFHNTVFEKNGKKFVESIGIEHYHNVFGALERVVEALRARS
ncbi:PAS domain S-box protein [Hydrogenimonas sp.]